METEHKKDEPARRTGRVLLAVAIALVVVFSVWALRVSAESPNATPGVGEGDDSAPVVESSITPGNAPMLVAAGRKTYQQFCVACHGPLPGGASPLGPALAAREYLAFATNRRIDSLIAHGVPGTAMIAWSKRRGGMLDDAQMRELLYYIRSLEPSAPSVPTWRDGRRERLP